MSRSQTKRRRSSAGKNVAVFFIVFVLLEGLLIFGLTKVFSNEDSVASIAGYSFFLMDSDNMGQEPPKDSLVIVSNGVPSSDKCGYTILARNVGDQGTTVGWLYEVGAKGDTVDHVVYTIYQENAPDKMYDLTSADIVGQATSYYMTAGKIISFLVTPFGMAVALAAPLVLMIIIELIIAAVRRSGDDYDYIDDTERMQPNENITLDDFLYGGQDDEVYTSGKPKGSFEDEFEDKYAGMADRQAAQYPDAKPDFSANMSAPEPVYEQPEPAAPAAPAAPVAPAPVAPAPAPQPQPEPEAPTAAPSVDPSYYEKASKLIDEAAAPVQEAAPEAVEAVAPAPKPEPAQEAPRRQQPNPNGGQRRRPPQGRPANGQRRRPAGQRPAQRPAVPHKDANATLEELMKLMEEEQQKLRDTHSGGDK